MTLLHYLKPKERPARLPTSFPLPCPLAIPRMEKALRNQLAYLPLLLPSRRTIARSHSSIRFKPTASRRTIFSLRTRGLSLVCPRFPATPRPYLVQSQPHGRSFCPPTLRRCPVSVLGLNTNKTSFLLLALTVQRCPSTCSRPFVAATASTRSGLSVVADAFITPTCPPT